MIAGHTKFEPDLHFGVWKFKWRNSNVKTLTEVNLSMQMTSWISINFTKVTLSKLSKNVPVFDSKKRTVYVFLQVAESVHRSSKNGHNIPKIIQDQDKPVVFYDWKTYLQKFFKPLKNLTRYHHFQFHADNPGRIEVKERNSGNPVFVNVLKGNVQPTAGQLPNVITEGTWHWKTMVFVWEYQRI